MALILVVEDQAELAQLLAAALEDAGYRVMLAGTAEEADRCLDRFPMAGMLLDLLLPDGLGFDLARKAKALAQPPLVLATSGVFRNDPAVDTALSDGIFDAFFEKPYRTRELLDRLSDLLPAPPVPPPADERMRSDPLLQLDAQAVEGTPSDFIFDAPEGGLAAAIAAEAERAPAEPEAPGRMTTLGDLGEHNVPHLITAFYVAGESGELHVTRGKVRKVIYFHEGVPAFAASNLRKDRFDELLLARGALDAEAVRKAAREARKREARVDRLLLEKGLLTSSRYRTLVTEQVKQILFSLFPWQEGRWEMTFEHHAETEPVRLEIFPADLILEGCLTLGQDTLESLLGTDTRLAPAPAPNFELYELSLSGAQALVVSRLDGTRSVTDLAEEGWLGVHETYALLYALRCLGVVEDASLLLL
ncbi:MAG: response regulator [Deltaproteobacteria bacterium]|nr:response regulator [Deltaproteobacteria bacterium]